MPRLYPDNRSRLARECVAHFQALGQQFDLSSALARDFAAGVADAWASWRAIKRQLAALEAKRDRGRGRCPSTHAVERLRRREGLQWAKYESALARLRELATAARRRPISGADLLAMQREAGG
jgi:hypothetical protein